MRNLHALVTPHILRTFIRLDALSQLQKEVFSCVAIAHIFFLSVAASPLALPVDKLSHLNMIRPNPAHPASGSRRLHPAAAAAATNIITIIVVIVVVVDIWGCDVKALPIWIHAFIAFIDGCVSA